MPNQYNAYLYCFGLSALSFIAVAFVRVINPSAVGRQYILLTQGISFFAFGLLILRTRRTRLNAARKKAYKQAEPIIHNLSEYIPVGNNGNQVRVVEVVQKASSPNVTEEDIYRLYDLVPACLLPPILREEGPHLDWHKYDLCIVASDHDLRLARRIENVLRSQYPQLKIFVDDDLVIGPQEQLFRRIYYAGSRLCLALISVHLIHDGRRKEQLNLARQREELSRKRIGACSATYLKPIPMDQPGMQLMQKEKDLAPFVEHVSLISDRDQLYMQVAKSLSHEIETRLFFFPVTQRRPDLFSIFISHSHADQVFGRSLYRDLRARSINCWFAPEDMLIGDKIRDAIEKALRQQRKVLLILSEDALQSSWVELEVELAFEMESQSGRTLLFPIKIDSVVDNATSPWARQLAGQRNIGDFTDWRNPQSYKRALERLIRALSSEEESSKAATDMH